MDQDPTSRAAAAPKEPPPAEPGAPSDAAAQAVMARMVARHGAPSLDDYRRTYTAAGLDWPGDEAIRARHPVADPGIATNTSSRHSAA